MWRFLCVPAVLFASVAQAQIQYQTPGWQPGYQPYQVPVYHQPVESGYYQGSWQRDVQPAYSMPAYAPQPYQMPAYQPWQSYQAPAYQAPAYVPQPVQNNWYYYQPQPTYQPYCQPTYCQPTCYRPQCVNYCRPWWYW